MHFWMQAHGNNKALVVDLLLQSSHLKQHMSSIYRSEHSGADCVGKRKVQVEDDIWVTD
jgi:hypothetical protein